jgi:hypothetical protein
MAAASGRSARLDGHRRRRQDLAGRHGRTTPAVHLVAAYAHEAPVVLAELRVEAETNEHKAALELLGLLPLEGAVITADAMFTRDDFCREVRRGGGDYPPAVEENQPTLLHDIEAVFAPDAGCSPLSTTSA